MMKNKYLAYMETGYLQCDTLEEALSYSTIVEHIKFPKNSEMIDIKKAFDFYRNYFNYNERGSCE